MIAPPFQCRILTAKMVFVNFFLPIQFKIKHEWDVERSPL